MDAWVLTEYCADLLDRVGIGVIACVPETRCVADLAVAVSPTRVAVIRAVRRAAVSDQRALAEMLCAGDFVWAGLIFDERGGAEAVGPIEAFHVSDLDRLVARLTKLSEVFDGST